MEMTVAGGGVIPAPLRPKLTFTGTSILTFDGRGKICKHVDTWVSISFFLFFPFLTPPPSLPVKQFQNLTISLSLSLSLFSLSPSL